MTLESIELRHLRYFLAVAEHLSFTRAAAALGLSQPTLSHQVAQLERDLGASLFERMGRGVRLTGAGVEFRLYAERALEELRSGAAALADLEGVARGTLAIGAFQSFNSSLLPPILAEFSAAHPGVSVTVRQLPTGEMETRLMRGELDFGIAYVPPALDCIVAEKLFDEPLMLVVGEGHPLASRRAVDVHELDKVPLILLTPEYPSRKLMADWFAAAGCTPQVRIQISSTDAALATAQCSGLATIQTERMTKPFPGLRCVRITPALTRSVAVFWRRDGYRSAAARVALEMITKAYGGAGARAVPRATTNPSRAARR